jgi:hypothetical protein
MDKIIGQEFCYKGTVLVAEEKKSGCLGCHFYEFSSCNINNAPFDCNGEFIFVQSKTSWLSNHNQKEKTITYYFDNGYKIIHRLDIKKAYKILCEKSDIFSTSEMTNDEYLCFLLKTAKEVVK